LFLSLRATALIMLNGACAETEDGGSEPLTLVPPSMIGSPELIHTDMRDATKSGVVLADRVTWIPWDPGALYCKHSLPAHPGILRDRIDRLMPDRQLRTTAHPLVEISMMRHGSRTLIHVINLSGHSQTGHFRRYR
jgi:hypothetical protein